MASAVKDRFFVTLGRLMRLAGNEYDAVRSEFGEEWNFLSEKQRFDILDKHVLEITADVIHDLPTFMNEWKLSLELSNKSTQTAGATSDLSEPATKKTDSSKKGTEGVKNNTDQASKKGVSYDVKKKATTDNAKTGQKKATNEPTTKDSSAESKENNEATISLQVNIHRLKKLMPTQLRILLKSMADDQLPDLEILEAIIDESEKNPEEKEAGENNVTEKGLDPEIEQLFAAVNRKSDQIGANDNALANDTGAPPNTGDDEDLEEVFRTFADKTPYFPTQPYFGRTFVVDNGSETIRAGFGDEQCPRVSIVNAVEMPSQTAENEKLKEAGEGSKRTKKLQYTMENGLINNWDDMQEMWTHIFKSLYINPVEHPVLMSDVAINPGENRKKITEIMFEEYHVPAFCIQSQSVLSMYGAGTPTGIAVDIGESIATVLPVYEYTPVSHALQTSKIAGSYLNRQLIRAMKRHYLDDRHILTQPELAREIKEKYCYVASDFEEEKKESTKSPGIQKAVCNPGLEVFLSDEIFTVPEAIFKPKVMGEDNCPGISELILNCVRDTDVQLRPEFCDNVVLSGGTTLLPGFVERLRKELSKMDPLLNVIAPSDRKDLVWRGGTVLSTMPYFQNGLITAQDYMEFGADIVHKKCA